MCFEWQGSSRGTTCQSVGAGHVEAAREDNTTWPALQLAELTALPGSGMAATIAALESVNEKISAETSQESPEMEHVPAWPKGFLAPLLPQLSSMLSAVFQPTEELVLQSRLGEE